MCCHPSTTRIFSNISDRHSRTKARIPHINLMRTSSSLSNGMRSRPDFSKDRSNLSNTSRARNSKLEFSKRLPSTPRTSQSPQSHSPKSRQPNTRSWHPILPTLGNSLSSSNKKLKMSVGNKKNSWRL